MKTGVRQPAPQNPRVLWEEGEPQASNKGVGVACKGCFTCLQGKSCGTTKKLRREVPVPVLAATDQWGDFGESTGACWVSVLLFLKQREKY